MLREMTEVVRHEIERADRAQAELERLLESFHGTVAVSSQRGSAVEPLLPPLPSPAASLSVSNDTFPPPPPPTASVQPTRHTRYARALLERASHQKGHAASSANVAKAKEHFAAAKLASSTNDHELACVSLELPSPRSGSAFYFWHRALTTPRTATATPEKRWRCRVSQTSTSPQPAYVFYRAYHPPAHSSDLEIALRCHPPTPWIAARAFQQPAHSSIPLHARTLTRLAPYPTVNRLALGGRIRSQPEAINSRLSRKHALAPGRRGHRQGAIQTRPAGPGGVAGDAQCRRRQAPAVRSEYDGCGRLEPKEL